MERSAGIPGPSQKACQAAKQRPRSFPPRCTSLKIATLESLDNQPQTMIHESDNVLPAPAKGIDFTITATDIPRVTLLLDDRMADLDQPLSVVWEGREVFGGRVPR